MNLPIVQTASFLGCLCYSCMVIARADVKLQRDDDRSQLTVRVDGREAIVYQYGAQYALPHYWPLRSPSGKLLTSQVPDPYPHHRSLWIADKVQAAGAPPVDFYHCWKNYRQPDDPESGYRHFIRHQRFGNLTSDGETATIETQLSWIINESRTVLDENRKLRVVSLEGGEYRLDFEWELKASQGDVKFVSDDVHYAWPYVRMHPQFSGERGGIISSDQGQQGQAGTNGKAAHWIDYSNTLDGTTEGLAVFVFPDGQSRKWLTREYGTFGPRRCDKFSGTQFVLESGESLRGRAGILIHRGDVASGRVAERYQQYIETEP